MNNYPIKTGKYIVCTFCKRKFYIARWKLRKKRKFGHFCSFSCHQSFRIDTKRDPPSEETRKKISNSSHKTGSFHSCQTCGKDHWVMLSVQKTGRGKFCSRECQWGRKYNPNGVFLDGSGYRVIRTGNPGKYKYAREHCFVVENFIGRKLHKNEVVHHINEIKNDNRIENLYIFPSSSKHITYHGLLRCGKVKKIIESNLPIIKNAITQF